MKNLIYQYWDGPIRESVKAGVRAMTEYAARIGAAYIFEDNPQYVRKQLRKNFGSYSPHYGAFKPVFEKEFQDYDNLLFCDTDVFPVEGLNKNVFEEFVGEVGICTEPFQPKQRLITKGRITTQQDELWAKTVERAFRFKVPRTEEGLVKVYNSGMVLYSREGKEKAKEWVSFGKYVNLIKGTNGLDSFYTCDQPYLHAMIFANNMDVQEMNNKWNSYIHGTRDKNHPKRYIVDHRTADSCFVHCQFPGADDMNENQLLKVVNLPREKWDFDI